MRGVAVARERALTDALPPKIVHAQTEDKEAVIEFRIYSLDGNLEHEQFIDGKIQGLAINPETGDIFMTKQPQVGEDESVIFK